MIDQRVSEGEKINFFNKSALTTTLPAQLSIKYNLPIIPVFIERINANKFQLIFHSQIKPDNYNDFVHMDDFNREYKEYLNNCITCATWLSLAPKKMLTAASMTHGLKS